MKFELRFRWSRPFQMIVSTLCGLNLLYYPLLHFSLIVLPIVLFIVQILQRRYFPFQVVRIRWLQISLTELSEALPWLRIPQVRVASKGGVLLLYLLRNFGDASRGWLFLRLAVARLATPELVHRFSQVFLQFVSGQ